MPLLPDQEEEAAALHKPHSDVQCVVYDCARHPTLQNFTVIDTLVLNC